MPRWYITAAVFIMKKCFVVLSALILMAFCSCQKIAGDPISEEFSISGTYTKLEVEDAFEVTVTDEVSQITVTVGENIMPKVVVKKVNNTLKIYCQSLTIPAGEMKVKLPYNADLTSVDLSGASEFHSEYGLDGSKVKVELSGASEFYCNITGNEADIDLSGASVFVGNIDVQDVDMEVSGSSHIGGDIESTELSLELSGASDATFIGDVGKLHIDLYGASRIIATLDLGRYGLACEQCEGEMSGASTAYIHCDGEIKVNLSGSSKLHFTGEGNPADSSTSGGSEIIHDENP